MAWARQHEPYEQKEARGRTCWRCLKPVDASVGRGRVAAHPGCGQPCEGPGDKPGTFCGKPFTPYGKGKYCSDECRNRAIAKQRRIRRGHMREFGL